MLIHYLSGDHTDDKALIAADIDRADGFGIAWRLPKKA
jgi:hypothetical protein